MAFALRLYRKQPGTVLAAVAGLALAIGLTTAVVSGVNATMYRRLTLPDAPLLRWVRSTETTPVASGVSLIRQFTYRELTQLAAQTDESRLAGVVSATASHEGHDEGLAAGVSTWFVSGGFFEIAGSPPTAHGRLLGPADDTWTSRAPVVINHTYWRRTFGADPAIVGLYGLTAFRVRQRVREIGVRMALGASRGVVIRSLLRDGLRPVVVGLVVGVGAAAVFAQLLAVILLGIPPHDPVSILGAAIVLLTAAAAAIFISALRTAVLDPSVALRTE